MQSLENQNKILEDRIRTLTLELENDHIESMEVKKKCAALERKVIAGTGKPSNSGRIAPSSETEERLIQENAYLKNQMNDLHQRITDKEKDHDAISRDRDELLKRGDQSKEKVEELAKENQKLSENNLLLKKKLNLVITGNNPAQITDGQVDTIIVNQNGPSSNSQVSVSNSLPNQIDPTGSSVNTLLRSENERLKLQLQEKERLHIMNLNQMEKINGDLFESLTKENKELSKDKLGLMSKLKLVLEKNQHLTVSANKGENFASQAEVQVGSLKHEMQVLRDSIDTLEAENLALQKKNIELMEKNEHLWNNINNGQHSMQEAEKVIVQLMNENQMLKLSLSPDDVERRIPFHQESSVENQGASDRNSINSQGNSSTGHLNRPDSQNQFNALNQFGIQNLVQNQGDGARRQHQIGGQAQGVLGPQPRNPSPNGIDRRGQEIMNQYRNQDGRLSSTGRGESNGGQTVGVLDGSSQRPRVQSSSIERRGEDVMKQFRIDEARNIIHQTARTSSQTSRSISPSQLGVLSNFIHRPANGRTQTSPRTVQGTERRLSPGQGISSAYQSQTNGMNTPGRLIGGLTSRPPLDAYSQNLVHRISQLPAQNSNVSSRTQIQAQQSPSRVYTDSIRNVLPPGRLLIT